MYKINGFSNKSNTSVQTLRYYDSIDLFKPSYIDNFTNYRYYTDEQLNTIKIINNLKEIGLSLSDIKLYLENKDVNILINQKNTYNEKIKKIEEIINMKEEIKYEIVESDYKKYVEVNGTKSIKTAMAIELKDNNAKYYIINKNSEFFDDFVIYNENKWLTLNNNYFKDKDLINNIFSFLKENDYNYVISYLPISFEELFKTIEKEYDISKGITKQGNLDFYKITFNL